MAIVTIGIPVYNEADYLRETIDSALSQTLSDIEIVISDNASTDQSFEIMSEYSKGDPRVRVIRQEENIGPLNNFRYVLDESKTPYFVWLGGHDLFEKDYLEKAVNCLKSEQGIVMAYPRNAIFVDKENNYLQGEACSNIDTRGIEWPLKRVKHIVKSLINSTNIHGVFRTKALKKLPFEHVIGSDNLMLATAGVFGHIRDINIVGIRRREIRTEDSSERHKRWLEMGVFTKEEGENPYKKLVDLHLWHIKNSKEIRLLDSLLNLYFLRKALCKRYYLGHYFFWMRLT